MIEQRKRKFEEFTFERNLRKQLIAAGFNVRKFTLRCDDDRRAFPDLTVVHLGEPAIHIECKLNTSLHVMTQAIGQCMIYNRHVPMSIICVPEMRWIANDVQEVCWSQSISICCPKTIENELSCELPPLEEQLLKAKQKREQAEAYEKERNRVWWERFRACNDVPAMLDHIRAPAQA